MRKIHIGLLTLAILLTGSNESWAGKPSFSSGSRPTYSSSSKSYSGTSFGGVKQSSPPSTGKSFSGGGQTTPKPPTAPPTNSGKSFSGGQTGKSYTGNSDKGYTGGKNTSIKPNTSFDSLGGKEQMKAESRAAFQKSQAPKTEYKSSSGKTLTIDPKDAKIANLRSQLSQERWVNRDLRQQQFYGVYYSRPVVIYSDPYPSFFWWWLLDRSLDERAMWAYHHQSTMDQMRYRDMLAKDAQLEARIRQLESQGVKRDSSYTPKGMDQDLMYSNEYVDAVYNPVPTSEAWTVWKVFLVIGVIGGVMFLVWFVFIRRT